MARTFDEEMKRLRTLLIFVVGLGIVLFLFLRGKSPSIPSSSESVLISLREPYTGDLIVERKISDPNVIRSMAETFSSARSGGDHKCSSIGEISFITETGETTLKVLPGHNAGMYEFRLDGEMYRLSRESYIETLVAAGIDRDDIRLDEHPDIEQAGAGQPATRSQSGSEGSDKPQPESEGGSR